MIKSVTLAFVFVILGLAAPLRAEFEPPIPVRMVPPAFPADMREQLINGVVTVNCLVDSEGDVQDLKVEKFTNQAFVEPALAALRKWKFKPAQRDGDIVAVRVSIPIRFKVEG